MSWEFEALFDIERDNQTGWNLLTWMDGEWKKGTTDLHVGKMGYRTRTTVAGPRLEAEVYPIFGRVTEAALRRAKKTNITPEKQARLNHERSIRHLVQLADANFDERDIHLTLTYRNAPNYERAQKDMRNFTLRIKRLREKRGLPALKYIYTIEGDDDGNRERIHIHMLMNGDMDREEMEQIWQKGYANADRLRPDENGLEAIARYIVKQQKNRRKWCASRNLKQPKSRTSDSRVTNARVKRIAFDLKNTAREEMEKVYPGYQFVKCSVRYSDLVDGAYIRCVMRKKEEYHGRAQHDRPGTGKAGGRAVQEIRL
ncbi:MAG: hypothetical protein J6Y48_06145 [Clostridia bacterium]|nr:hypothetical protein [Clostridia bacterium]